MVAETAFWLGEALVRSAFGWRLLLSPRYRTAALRRWRTDGGLHAGAELAGAVLGLLLSAALLIWLAAGALR